MNPGHLPAIILAIAASAAAAFAAQALPGGVDFDTIFQERPVVEPVTLDNGLVVLIEENPANPVVAVRATVRAGSIYEGDYLGYGLSHVLEHIVSRGTTSTRTEAEYRDAMTAMGASGNATTSHHRTSYYMTCPARDVETAVTFIAEWVFDNAMDDGEWRREMGVVQRELERGLANPGWAFWHRAQAQIYRIHPARHPIIGYAEFLEGVDDPERPQYEAFRNYVREYYRRFYTPENMVLSIVGDIDRDAVLEVVSKTFGAAPRGSGTAPVLPVEPPQMGPRRDSFPFDVQETWYRISYRTVSLGHPDTYPLDVMARVLSSGVRARLMRSIRDEKQLAHVIGAWSSTPDYAEGAFSVHARTQFDKLPALEAAIQEELQRLKEELIGSEELQRAKIHTMRDYLLEGQTAAERASRLAGNYLATGNPNYGRTYTETIRAVTAADVQRVAQQYLNERQSNTLIMHPRDVAVEPAGHDAVIEQDDVARIELPNGLRVMFRRDTSHPSLAVEAYALGGVRYEDDASAGSTNLMAGLLTRGAGGRNAEGIADAMDAIGGTLNADTGRQTFFLRQQLLKGTLDPGLAVLADCLLRPAFDATEFERLKARTLQAIRAENDQPSQQAFNFFNEKMYPGNPHSRNTLGTLESVSALTVEDVRAAWAQYVHPANVVVAIVGDATETEVRAAAERHLNFEPRGELPAPPTPAQRRQLDDDRFYHLETPPRRNSFVIMGYPGMTLLDDDDRHAMAVLEGILGGYGPPGGYLHADLRGRRLVYVVQAFNRVGLDPGAFMIYAECEPDKTEKVIGLIRGHVEHIREGRFTDDEFERARSSCVGFENMTRQTHAAVATSIALDELYGQPIGHFRAFADGIARVTRDDVIRVANRYLVHSVLTVIGPDPETLQAGDTRP